VDYLNPQLLRYVADGTRLSFQPAGWMKEPIRKHRLWVGPASDRFRSWFQEQDD
jgi:hypothetical protein